MDLSIIIVNYNTEELVKQSIESIYRYTVGINFEIIVVDNNSNDNCRQTVEDIDEKIQWYNIGYNSGFSRANNFGIKKAKGEFTLLLNSDTILKSNLLYDAIEKYKIIEQKKSIGLYSCKLLFHPTNNPGYPQLGGHLDFPNFTNTLKKNIFFNYFYDRNGHKSQIELERLKSANNSSLFVSWVAAAFALIRTDKIIKHDLFLDEDFFMYSEDVEWNKRITKNGLNNYYDGEYEIYHLGGASSQANINKYTQIQISEILYIRKSHNLIYYITYCLLSFTNSFLEIVYERYLRFRRKPSVYNKTESIWKMKIYFKWSFRILFYRQFLKNEKFLKYENFGN